MGAWTLRSAPATRPKLMGPFTPSNTHSDRSSGRSDAPKRNDIEPSGSTARSSRRDTDAKPIALGQAVALRAVVAPVGR